MTEQPYTDHEIVLAAMLRLHHMLDGRDAPGHDMSPDGSCRACRMVATAALDELVAAGRLLPEGASPDRRMWIFPIEAKVDAILPDGRHRYWSTHCRHGNHDACSASTMTRHRVAGGPLEAVPRPVEVHKAPAQCKTCSSPCICPCHAPVPINEESTDR